MKIKIVDAERVDGNMSADSASLALRLLREVGAVILENAVPLEIVNEVRSAAAIQLGDKFMRPGKMPFMHRQIVANPFALQILEAAMGKKIALAHYNLRSGVPAVEGEYFSSSPGRPATTSFPSCTVCFPSRVPL
jgi:hypothetical protein